MRGREQWMCWDEDLEVELRQAEEEGRDAPWLPAAVQEILALPEDHPGREEMAGALLDRVMAAPLRPGYAYTEPDGLEDIIALAPGWSRGAQSPPAGDELRDRVYGAWLGRCAGCLLGKPVEGAKRTELYPALKRAGNYPIGRYIAYDSAAPLDKNRAWAGTVPCMPEDDDTNYTFFSLLLLEQHGRGFTPADVARGWQSMFPLLHVFTAERIAYKNFVLGMQPPQSAGYRNPYREWIGAQIRTDFYGYISPGQPAQAAGYAHRDASVSHVKNGIYGAMFAAAMVAAAGGAGSRTAEQIIQAGLDHIPENSRLAAAVREFMAFCAQHPSWQDAADYIHTRYDEYSPHDWCHTIPNALVVCLGLLYGEMDFGKSIGLAVTALFDSDCNGATVGSIVGMARGAAAIPESWKAPLNDAVETGLAGYGRLEISDLAERTCAFL